MLRQGLFQTAHRWFCGFMTIVFVVTGLPVHASEGIVLTGQAGTMVGFSDPYQPPMLAGVKVRVDDPLKFDFILDKGGLSGPGFVASDDSSETLKAQSEQLIRYFLAALTVPEDDLWVNLSPYEKDRIIPDEFGLTEMGRDLLAQDYLLKQITASAIYPQEDLGREFWKKVYAKAYEAYGSSDIPVDAFNKVWIVPERAVVYEKIDGLQNGFAAAYVVEARLKVLLESDYLASQQAMGAVDAGAAPVQGQELAKDVLREVVLPALEREVNEGKNFAPLRQIYHSLILADWYKKKVKDSLLSAVYVDQKKVVGVNVDDPEVSRKIWAQYVETFRKGAFSIIREERDEMSGEMIPRKYFSGGCSLKLTDQAMIVTGPDAIPRSDPGRFAVISSGIQVPEGVASGGRPFRMGDDMSFHVNTFRSLLDGINVFGLIQDPPDPGNPNLWQKYFKGLSVVNLGPETKSYDFMSGDNRENFKAYSLVHAFQSRGIDAVAVSPRNGDPIADKVFDGVNFVEGLDREMPFPDSSKDVVVSIGLYDPSYYETIMGNGPAEYRAAAREIRRVLKNGGRLIIHAMSANPALLAALRAEGFEVAKINSLGGFVLDEGMYLCVNKKSVGQVSSEGFQPRNPVSDAAMSAEFRTKILRKQSELREYAAALRASLPARFSGIRWESAAEVPWQEIIREPVPEDPGQPAEIDDIKFGTAVNRWNYWSNQLDVRRDFLDLLVSSLRRGAAVDPADAKAYLKRAHHDLILGSAEDSPYYPPTMLSMSRNRALSGLQDVANALLLTEEGIAEFAEAVNVIIRSLEESPSDLDNLAPVLFRMHKIFITPGIEWSRGAFAFPFGNNSLSMNQVNAVLRLSDREGIAHDGIDFVLLKNWFDDTVAYGHFLKLLRSTVNISDGLKDAGADPAQKGGIDLARREAFRTSGSSGAIRFDIAPGDLQRLRDAPGFAPVIFSIQPADDLLRFLGARTEDPGVPAG